MLKLVDSSRDENDIVSLSLDELARLGAKKLLAEALQLEVTEYIEANGSAVDEDGHRLVVRNGQARERRVTTGAGTIAVKAPRVDDRRAGQKFSSSILPPYLRKSANVESVLPALYLKGLSGNSFSEALADLLGENASGLSPSSISSLKKRWIAERDLWRKRRLNRRYVYVWADGVNVKIRIGEDKKLCLLVLIGATESGNKEVIAIEAGYRESAESWSILFRDILSRGFEAPMLMIGDGALGLWKAVSDMPEFEHTRTQRCWVHKIANVLDKLPKRLQPQAKRMLHDMMNAARASDAEVVKREFNDAFADRYPKASKCLDTGWSNLITHFDFPAGHWSHIRSTNPIESMFATIKLRTRTTKGAGNPTMAEVMAFKLAKEAQKRWRRLNALADLHKLVEGAVYKDGNLRYESGESREVVNS